MVRVKYICMKLKKHLRIHRGFLSGRIAKPEEWELSGSGCIAMLSILGNCSLKIVICASCSRSKMFGGEI